MLGRGMMEDGEGLWSLVLGQEVTEPRGSVWIKTNKQRSNQRLTATSRADNETGTDLVEPAPSLEGPAETQPASHEEVWCSMLLLQQEIV